MAALSSCLLARAAQAQTRADVTFTDAGVPDTDGGGPPAYAQDFQRQARQIRAFLAGQLDLAVDPASLFELPLDIPDEAMRVERERLVLVLRHADAAGTASTSRATQPRVPLSPGDVATLLEPVSALKAPSRATAPELEGWRARLELDRARLAFYELSAARRVELVQAHEARRQQALSVDRDQAMNLAEAEARSAEQQQRDALEAARRSSTEAARLINEEHARLLAVTREQAQYDSALLQRRAELDARSEAVLGWKRRVVELGAMPTLDPVARSRADAAYVELRARLSEARARLSHTLSTMGDGVRRVPRPGPDPLVDLPAEIDASVAVAQRQKVTEKALQLEQATRTLELDEAQQLMSEVELLNRLRLELLDGLSPDKRESILGFGRAGWDQAVAEVRHVGLTLRYHLHAAFDWLSAIRQGDRRGQSAWLAVTLLLKWALPIGLFVWWRRHADAVLEALNARQRERARTRRDGDWIADDYAERGVRILRRVRRPLEWLLLVGLGTWVMPEEVKNLLEVRVLSRVLLWTFGGLFIVLAVDSLASDDGPRGASETAQLRLRSLRLVGRAIVGFGLPLSLSELLVGRGTVYGWVITLCWFAILPVLFVIVGWWRPFIFERFGRMRRPNTFERWVLGNRTPKANVFASTLSSLAAVGGGVYLFVRGALRIVRSRVLTFELTRRILAYLFRRDLSKKALDAPVESCAPLTRDVFRALGPEVSAVDLVRSAADVQVEAVIQGIKAAGGGAIAIVGERGSGRTTLLERIARSCPGTIALKCSADGLPGLRTRLNEALGLEAATELETAAASIDARSGDHALLIDDAQHLVRPAMGGLVQLDGMLSLLRRHSKECTWVLAFDEAIWHFVALSRGAEPLFDRVIRLSPWNEESIVRLITRRNDAAGVAPDFAGLASSLPPSADEVDLREAIRRTEASYYRLLWDYASGNPGVALHFWRRSLGVAASGKVLVRLFDAPDTAQLEALPDSSAFVLRAIVQLGWAAREDIVQVTCLSLEQVEDALRYGNHHGYFDVDGDHYRVNWDWFRAVTRFLQRRHLSLSTP